MAANQSSIEQNQIFAGLRPAKRKALFQEAVSRQYQKGEYLACAGETWPYLFVVVSGAVDAVKESSEGRSLVVTTFLPGEVFWGLAFFHDEMPMPATLRASAATGVLLWPRERVLPYIRESGEMAWELAREAIMKMTLASEILEEITFQPVTGRLARLLLETAQTGSSAPTSRSLTLDEMAARIGSTREVVCRFLHRFADEGMIDITRTEFRVTDQVRLSNLAKNVK